MPDPLRLIVDAIDAGDEEGAAQRMREHLAVVAAVPYIVSDG